MILSIGDDDENNEDDNHVTLESVANLCILAYMLNSIYIGIHAQQYIYWHKCSKSEEEKNVDAFGWVVVSSL